METSESSAGNLSFFFFYFSIFYQTKLYLNVITIDKTQVAQTNQVVEVNKAFLIVTHHDLPDYDCDDNYILHDHCYTFFFFS